jgi:hypothetical protein
LLCHRLYFEKFEKDGKSTIIGSSTEALYANTSVPDSDTLLAKERGKESFNNLAYSSGNFRLLLLLDHKSCLNLVLMY